MIKLEDFGKYELYLKYIDKKLQGFFEEQAPYIFCKEGCSHCCEEGEYPMSEIEFAYLTVGAKMLPLDVIAQIEKNMFRIKAEKENHKGDDTFRHACPFLCNNRCSVYKYRAIICRTHGIAFFNAQKKLMVPACVNIGLNYSNVYDPETDMLSTEKYKELGFTQEPLAHNVGLSFMVNNDLTKELCLNFGELKPMYKWFLPDDV